jgi:glutathione S-transferase
VLKLLIGNKNYSSWSLRPWLLLSHAQIPFEEECLSFNAPDFKASVGRYSPVGKVPVLIHDDLVIWDSLAIAEYVAELFPEKFLWPEHRTSRAHARSLCAEMHAGFQAMRAAMPMNCSHRFENALFPLPVQNNVQRIVDIWEDCRNRYADEGPFLFGAFSVADAYFAPVVQRFATYNVTVPNASNRYMRIISDLPSMKRWIVAAKAENDFILEDEPYRTGP